MATLQLISNPSRRKRRKARKSRKLRRNPVSAVRAVKRRRRRSRKSPVMRVRRRRSRNLFGKSRGGIIGNIMSTVKPAGYAAAGIVALDVVWSYLPLPDSLKLGAVRHVAKAGGAIALGMIAERVFGKETGRLIGVGAMTGVLVTIAREAIGTFAPNLRLAGLADEYPELAYINPAAIQDNSVGEYQDTSMGEYQFDSSNL
jgi:hypothetical protein